MELIARPIELLQREAKPHGPERPHCLGAERSQCPARKMSVAATSTMTPSLSTPSMPPSMMTRSNARQRKVNVFKSVEETPSRYAGVFHPINQDEQKELFLKYGWQPKFVLNGNSGAKLGRVLNNKGKRQICFDLLPEAVEILEMVNRTFQDSSRFVLANYGPQISIEEATDLINQYLTEHGLDGEMTIVWSSDLICSAKMMWHGPHIRQNRPEARKFTLIIRNSPENNYIRQHGVVCLMNHEVGTHYMRMVNDGFQPWFSDRKRFDLHPLSERICMSTEEGLAAINTTLGAKTNFLWGPALLYYTACKAYEMSFRDLYTHLERYVANPDQRWRLVMRVKRGMIDSGEPGGYGSDQVYFEGAVAILRNLENLDFSVLYSGKVALDEVNRLRRLARLDFIKLPNFMRNIKQYRRALYNIGVANRIIPRQVTVPRVLSDNSTSLDKRSSLNLKAYRTWSAAQERQETPSPLDALSFLARPLNDLPTATLSTSPRKRRCPAPPPRIFTTLNRVVTKTPRKRGHSVPLYYPHSEPTLPTIDQPDRQSYEAA